MGRVLRPCPLPGADLAQRLNALEARIVLLEGRARARDEHHAAALLAIHAVMRGRAFLTREVVVVAQANHKLRASLLVAGLVDARRLGRWFRTIQGTTVGGLRLEPATCEGGRILWVFVPVSQPR